MTEGLVKQLTDNMQASAAIVATGGFASSIARVTGCFDAVKPDLLLEGLRMLYVEQGAPQ